MRRFITLFLLLFATCYSFGQLTVSRVAPNNSINYLVKNILLGNGVTVSNITFSGDDTAIGFFNGISSNIGLDSGLILTNCAVTDAPGPNNSPSKGYAWPGCGAYHDSDLAALIGDLYTDTHSSAILEFDFVPYSDTVSFQYVFGSDEYPEYVNTPYNDVFGFFVSGPGISGPYSHNAENIALIPFTTTPVAINNVNCNLNWNYYVCNWYDTVTYPCMVNCPTLAQMPATTVQFDGFTTPLTATAIVECGKQYHIKIAICNIGDCIYGSGVFLKSGSFKSSGVAVSSAISYMNTINSNDTILYRGTCGMASLYFERGTGTTSDTIFIDTSGTASPGIDYTPIPDTLILGKGVLGDTLNINAFPSTKPGIQTIILTIIQRSCNTTDTQKVTIYIGNPDTLRAKEPPLTVCYGGSATLDPSVTGGVASYSYLWYNGATTSSITVNNITSDTTFTVRVNDVCGDTTKDTVHVNVVTTIPLKLTAKDTTISCPDTAITISVVASGGKPNYVYSWSTGGTTSSVNVSPYSTTKYKVTVSDSCGEVRTDSVTVTVINKPLTIAARDTSINCGGSATLVVHAGGGGGGFTYLWNTGATTSSINVSPAHDTSYIVVVHTPCGNQSINDTVKVTVIPPGFTLKALGGGGVNCPNTMSTLSASVTPASGCLSYKWSNGATTSTITVKPYLTTLYTVTVKDTCCGVSIKMDTARVTVNTAPLVVTAHDVTVKCPGDTVTVSVSATGSGYISYKWKSLGTGPSHKVKPYSTTSYYVTVYDSCGNQTVKDTVTVKVPVYPGLSAKAIPDSLSICIGDLANLNATVSGGEGTYSYEWTANGPFSDSIFNSDMAQAYLYVHTSAIYTVKITDGCGNTVSENVVVTIIPDCNLIIPNVFTPNGDGTNQYFYIHNLDKFPNSKLFIYDRWGKKEYESDNYQNDWQGTSSSGAKLSDGVYYYILYLSDGKKYPGFVQLLR